MMGRRNWVRDELIVAFNLYCKLPFGQLHARNQHIIELAKLLGRTPGSVAMKLVNFAALDPTHQQRGVVGLKNTSKADQQVWDEFNANWTDLAVESERAYRALGGKGELLADTARSETEVTDLEILVRGQTETERDQMTRIRLGQAFFRCTILAAYRSRCCVCSLPEEELLVASHIVPWAVRADLRVNPRNGLCFCALHDRAFDRGLITVEADLTLKVGRQLEDHLPDQVVEKMFVAYRGRVIRSPEKFSPDADYLDYHRTAIFQRG